mgnify:FL=1
MNNAVSELEKELEQAEKRYRELTQLVEAAQENSEALERIISYLDDELSNQSEDGKRFIASQVTAHIKTYL